MAKNTKPKTHEQALWGADADFYMLELALRLTKGLSHDEGTASYKDAMACLNSDVLALLIDDIQLLKKKESDLRKLADAIEFVNAVTALQTQPFLKNHEIEFPAKKKYFVAFKIKLELEEGLRDQPPTSDEFVKLLEKAGCPDLNSSNAAKVAKDVGWKPTKIKTGPKPRKKI